MDTKRFTQTPSLYASASRSAGPSATTSLPSLTPYNDFSKRKVVQEQCPTSCIKLHSGYHEQLERETAARKQHRTLTNNERKLLELEKIRTSDAARKVDALVERAKDNMERSMNMSSGMMRNVYRDLDAARAVIDTVDGIPVPDGAKDALQSYMTNLPLTGKVDKSSRDYLEAAIHDTNVHNWSMMAPLSRLIHEMARREEQYESHLRRLGVPSPFPADGGRFISQRTRYNAPIAGVLSYFNGEGREQIDPTGNIVEVKERWVTGSAYGPK